MQMNVLKKSILFSLLISGVLFGDKVTAQKTLLDITIDDAAILIGEQTFVRSTITADKDKHIIFPLPQEFLTKGVEILGVTSPDTTLIDNDRLLIKQDILITSFDSALYLLPPLMVIDGNDTIYSNQVALSVETVPVNVDEPEEYADIKAVWKPPFVLADYYPIIFGIIAGLLLIGLAIYIFKRRKSRKSIIPFKKTPPPLPADVLAIRELDEIKKQKLWQQGRSKEYYTLITDTLRKYIVGRFGINALEMTSAEILEVIRRENEAESVYNNLKQILELSDFVKFAKMNPLPDENDLSMMNAYLFVNQTKPLEKPPVPQGEKVENKEPNDSTLTEKER